MATTRNDFSGTGLRTMNVFDMDDSPVRLLARARYIPGQGWSLKAHGFCWIDPRARKANAFGIVAPQFLFLRSKREAWRHLRLVG